MTRAVITKEDEAEILSWSFTHKLEDAWFRENGIRERARRGNAREKEHRPKGSRLDEMLKSLPKPQRRRRHR